MKQQKSGVTAAFPFASTIYGFYWFNLQKRTYTNEQISEQKRKTRKG